MGAPAGRSALRRTGAGPHRRTAKRAPGGARAVDSCDGTLVGRAALGISYVELDAEAVLALRSSLPMAHSATLLDAPAGLRAEIDPWGPVQAPALELMRSVKARFDPTRTCNPGLFVGGI